MGEEANQLMCLSANNLLSSWRPIVRIWLPLHYLLHWHNGIMCDQLVRCRREERGLLMCLSVKYLMSPRWPVISDTFTSNSSLCLRLYFHKGITSRLPWENNYVGCHWYWRIQAYCITELSDELIVACTSIVLCILVLFAVDYSLNQQYMSPLMKQQYTPTWKQQFTPPLNTTQQYVRLCWRQIEFVLKLKWRLGHSGFLFISI